MSRLRICLVVGLASVLLGACGSSTAAPLTATVTQTESVAPLTVTVITASTVTETSHRVETRTATTTVQPPTVTVVSTELAKPPQPAKTTTAVTKPADDSPWNGTPWGDPPKDGIRYIVAGTGTASISYMTGDGMSQATNVKLPWTINLSYVPKHLRSVTAQHVKGSGNIGCEIDADGAIASVNSSSGEYALVTCND